MLLTLVDDSLLYEEQLNKRVNLTSCIKTLNSYQRDYCFYCPSFISTDENSGTVSRSPINFLVKLVLPAPINVILNDIARKTSHIKLNNLFLSNKMLIVYTKTSNIYR